MIVWYVSLYEPLPIGDPSVRPMRTGMLADALWHDGHDVELWLPGFEHVHHRHFRAKTTSEQHKDRFLIHYLRGCGYKRDTSPMRFFHNRAVASEFTRVASHRPVPPDLVVTQIPSLELAEAVADYCRSRQIPFIVDIRDPWPDNYRRLLPTFLSWLYKGLFFCEIRRACKIIQGAIAVSAVSQSYLTWALSLAHRQLSRLDRVYHIGYPICPAASCSSESKELTRSKFGIKPNDMVFVFFGTFADNIDLATVLDAVKILHKRGVQGVRFVIAGKGELGSRMRRRLDELDNIHFAGWLQGHEIQDLLHISHVGLVPYSRVALQSLPNKPYEYMSASLALLNSLPGELAQLVNDHQLGLNYTAHNPDELAQQIIRMSDDRIAVERMGINGRAILERDFNSATIYRDFSNHIATIRDQHGRP